MWMFNIQLSMQLRLQIILANPFDFLKQGQQTRDYYTEEYVMAQVKSYRKHI